VPAGVSSRLQARLQHIWQVLARLCRPVRLRLHGGRCSHLTTRLGSGMQRCGRECTVTRRASGMTWRRRRWNVAAGSNDQPPV